MRSILFAAGASALFIFQGCHESENTITTKKTSDSIPSDTTIRPRSKIVKVQAFYFGPDGYLALINDSTEADSIRANFLLTYLNEYAEAGMSLRSFTDLFEKNDWLKKSGLRYARNNGLYYAKTDEIFDPANCFFVWQPFPNAYWIDSLGAQAGYYIEMQVRFTQQQRDSLVRKGRISPEFMFLRSHDMFNAICGKDSCVFGNARIIRLGLVGRNRIVKKMVQ